MKKITLFIAACTFSIMTWAQNPQGVSMLKYERYLSAKNVLQNASTPEDKYMLGLAEIGLENLTEAEKIFKSINDEEYGSAGLARVYLLQGKTDEAHALLEDLVKKVKRKEYYKYKLAADAITYTKKGDVMRAVEWHKLYIEKNPTPDAYIALGDAYLIKNDPKLNGEAEIAFEKALSLDPNNSLAYSRLAQFKFEAKQGEEALEFFTKAKDLDPNNPLPYRDLANAYYQIGKYELAKTNIEKYFELSDASENDEYQYLNILFLSKDYENSLVQIDKIMSKTNNPKNYLYRLLAYAQYENGNVDESLKNIELYFTKETSTSKHIPDDYKYRGLTHLAKASTIEEETEKNRLITQGESYISNAISQLKADDKKIALYNAVIEEYKKLKDYAKVASAYEEIVKIKGEEKSLNEVYYSGYYSFYAKDYEKALQIFEKMDVLFDNNRHISGYWASLAAIQLDLDAKSGRAVPHIEKWLATEFPEGKSATADQFKQVYQYLTYFYHNKSDKANAVKYANLLLQNDASSQYAQDILNYYK